MGHIEGKRIFISGGAGFISSHLVDRLVARNSIVVFDNFSRNAIKFSPALNHPNLKLIHGDILNANLVKRSARDCHIFIHCAAIAGIYTVGKKTSETIKVNLLGTNNLLEAIKDLNVERFVDFSTSEVYGPFIYKGTERDFTTQGPVHENRWAYAVSKLASEYLTFSYFQEHNLPIVVLRPFNIYGPRQVGEGAIQRMILQALNNDPITLYNDGTQIRAWCYIDDFLRALLACLTRQKAVGHVFNIGNPRAAITNITLASLIIALTRSRSKIIFKPHPGSEVQVRVPSIAKATKILGYLPRIELEQGISKTISWYKENKIS